LNKLNNGYTLVELLVTLALTGLVFLIAGMAIYQLSTVAGFGNNRLTAWHELQNTNLWLIRDGQQALRATGSNNLTLTLPDSSVVTYRLSGDILQRTSGNSVRNLAHNVSSLNFSIEDNLVTMDITTSISGRILDSVQSSYKVYFYAVQ
jgi:prepilin-type N-terminal cleavage/methylation domain-containing protein